MPTRRNQNVLNKTLGSHVVLSAALWKPFISGGSQACVFLKTFNASTAPSGNLSNV